MSDKNLQSKISRRGALGALGTATILGIGGLTTATRSPIPDDKQEQFYQRTKKQYGATEAEIALEIVKDEHRRQEKHKFSNKIRFENITTALLKHPDTPQGSADLRAVLEDLQLINDFNTKTNVPGGGASTQDNTCTDCNGGSDEYVIAIDDSEQVTKDAYGSTTKVKTNVDNTNQRGYVSTGLYGSGHATTRLFGTFYAPSDGEYNINAKYFRRAHITGVQAKISLVVRPSYGGWEAKPVENLHAPREESVEKTETFTLDGGYYHDVGVEVIAEGQSSSGEGDIADVYNDPANDGLRHLHVGELSVVQF